MASKPITITLTGDVTLADYVDVMSKLSNLLNALNDEVCPKHSVEWQISDLEAGSARSSVVCPSELEEDIRVANSIVSRYDDIGKDARRGDLSSYSRGVQDAVHAITNKINGKVKSVIFQTEDNEWPIHKNYINITGNELSCLEKVEFLESFGAIKGRIESISKHKRHSFRVYDLDNKNGVTCYLDPDFEEKMRDVWGKIAFVEGIIRRDPITGDPTSVRQVKNITVINEGTPGGWRKAMGCDPDYTGGVPSEDAIRKLRDG